MSLIRTLKSSGPSTEPCGIPHKTGREHDFLFAYIDFFHVGNFSITVMPCFVNHNIVIWTVKYHISDCQMLSIGRDIIYIYISVHSMQQVL